MGVRVLSWAERRTNRFGDQDFQPSLAVNTNTNSMKGHGSESSWYRSIGWTVGPPSEIETSSRRDVAVAERSSSRSGKIREGTLSLDIRPGKQTWGDLAGGSLTGGARWGSPAERRAPRGLTVAKL